MEAAAVARAQRTSYATGSNQASSRSHMLLYCIAELVPREGCAPAVQLKPWSSALLFADLAGAAAFGAAAAGGSVCQAGAAIPLGAGAATC